MPYKMVVKFLVSFNFMETYTIEIMHKFDVMMLYVVASDLSTHLTPLPLIIEL